MRALATSSWLLRWSTLMWVTAVIPNGMTVDVELRLDTEIVDVPLIVVVLPIRAALSDS